VNFPRVCLVRQNLVDRSLKDIPSEVQRELERAALASRIRPGARIAIGAGSRGIAGVATILRAVVDYWRAHGCKPFIFPAMGSHGSATAEGQAQVLAGYGITEGSMGCPIISSLDVVATGRTPEGIETFMDRSAHESDGVMLVGRVKWHTDFTGRNESGLVKMAAIGMGKLAGAQRYHTEGVHRGLENVLRSVYRQVARSGRLLGGLAILEDAAHSTARVVALPVEDLEEREAELLELVKSWMARIPVSPLDLLIVDEIGKSISGTGMDTRVINRTIEGHFDWDPHFPSIRRIFVRDFTAHSDGNATGVGMADFISDRLLAKINWQATYTNVLTAGNPAGSRLPVHFPTDRQCLEAIAQTVGRTDPAQIRIGWITNTMQLGSFAFSENLLAEVSKEPALHVASPLVPLPFDADGNLPTLGKLAGTAVGQK
jgi:hypothetical protein